MLKITPTSKMYHLFKSSLLPTLYWNFSGVWICQKGELLVKRAYYDVTSGKVTIDKYLYVIKNTKKLVKSTGRLLASFFFIIGIYISARTKQQG